MRPVLRSARAPQSSQVLSRPSYHPRQYQTHASTLTTQKRVQRSTPPPSRSILSAAAYTGRPFSVALPRFTQTPAKGSDKVDSNEQDKPLLGTPNRLPEYNLDGKVVVVSGAARGLGLVQAEALLEAGAIVHAIDRLDTPSEDFPRIQERAKGVLGTELHYHQLDVRDNAKLNKTFEEIGEKHGRLDGLIAAAGIQQETPALEYKAEDANLMFEINVTGVFMTAQAAARQMFKYGNGGSIVLLASMSGTVANRGLICPAYNSAKAGVVQLGRNLAMEWGNRGGQSIRVNSLSPGYIQTKMLTDLFIKFPEREKQWANDNMLNRISTPKEFRGAAVFLLSEASSFMTGSDLRIDGGHCAW